MSETIRKEAWRDHLTGLLHFAVTNTDVTWLSAGGDTGGVLNTIHHEKHPTTNTASVVLYMSA